MRSEREADHPPPSGAKVKNDWSGAFPVVYALMTSTGATSFFFHISRAAVRMFPYMVSAVERTTLNNKETVQCNCRLSYEEDIRKQYNAQFLN